LRTAPAHPEKLNGNPPSGRLFRILRAREVHFIPAQAAELAQMASKEGADTGRLVKDAVL